MLDEQRVTILNYTPSAFSRWLEHVQAKGVDENSHLRLIIFGGESICNANLQLWFQLPISEKVELFNMYGITETTVHNTYRQIKQNSLQERAIDNIGKPILGKAIHILNPSLESLPSGMVGEMFIEGHGLADGYFGKPELSRERFVAIQDNTKKEIRLYKTGDLARLLPNGELEYLGRCDQQVNFRGFRIELESIRYHLLQHKAVSQAMVILDESISEKRLLAYVVPEKKAMAMNGKGIESAEKRNQRWQAVYDQVYAKQENLIDPWFNIIGWHSSYTGKPIESAVMKAWVETTVYRILRFKPKNVLEIGCGTGLLLSRIAPHVDTYHGTDLSAASIEYIKSALIKSPLSCSQPKLTCRPADVIDKDDFGAYDMVILNSVIQYFPSGEYLFEVLSKALKCVKPGGHIYVGDVRSLLHLDLFYAKALLSSHHTKMSQLSLQQAILQKSWQESELVVNPQAFKKFKARHRRIESVLAELKASDYDDEMTLFRYDVTFFIKGGEPKVTKQALINKMDWSEVSDKTALQKLLSAKRKTTIRIHHIPNAKLHHLSAFVEQSATLPLKLLYARWAKQQPTGIDPLWCYELAQKYTYKAYVTWSQSDPLRCFDVLFYQDEMPDEDTGVQFDQSNPLLTNDPSNLEQKQYLSRQLKKHLGDYLPKYMHPQSIICIDSMPVTHHGKLDYAALPKAYSHSKQGLQGANHAADPLQSALARLWSSLLSIDEITADDDFFELGGHSLLAIQMLHEVEQLFSIRVPIHVLFAASTLSAFANEIQARLIDSQLQPEGVCYKTSTKSPIVELSAACDSRYGNPCFFFHPVGGTVFAYIPLVKQLKPDRAYYGVQDPSIYAKKPLFATIEEMVAHYIEHIRQIQPEGPYLLAGASMGGTLALEAASQLRKQGAQVDMIAMFDAWALFTEDFYDKQRLEAGMMRQYEIVQKKLNKISLPNPKLWLDINHSRLKLLLGYKPPIVEEKITLFKCKELFPEFIPIDRPDNYWQAHTNDTVEIYTTTGNHETMMLEPHVDRIADILNGKLSLVKQGRLAHVKD